MSRSILQRFMCTRNADRLIVVSGMDTGFWAFRVDGFNGWNGADWGIISSAHDWDNARGPGGRGGAGGGGR